MKQSELRAELLLEIGCEEIPAGMIAKAAGELQVLLEKYLATESLLGGSTVESFGAPRRLVAAVPGILLKQQDSSNEITGPPKSVAFDNVGKPTKAAESFASKQGVPLDKLYLVTTPRGEYLAARHSIPGRTAAALLSDILPRVIQEISWPRTMHWAGADGPRFIRPIRWIVALLGGKPIRFSFAGLAAGNHSSGHRFLGAAIIPVRGLRDYERKLRANFVLVRPEERRRKIEREIADWMKRTNLRLHEDAGLLEEVTYLNEFPSVILGNFDASFLDLPGEILITVMRGHQKYFAVEKKSGELAPHFLAVINHGRDVGGLIAAGHERVLKARFADARFFWESDQKCRLADYLPKLASVTYESRLGSYKDKVERMRAIARFLADHWFNSGLPQAHVADADRAAELAKCDLATEMVRELTELQGIVGGLYARAQGESEDVAWAVYDHYRPVGTDDPIPRNLTGCAVALADKLDSITGCFAAGLIPSGSSDPFALRRAALGIVKIILERHLPLSLSSSVGAAAKNLRTCPPKLPVTPDIEKEVIEFVLERARYFLRERSGFAYDEVNAVFKAGADDLVDAVRRLEALKAIRKTKNFAPLAISFKRIRKILEKATAAGGERRKPNPELFAEEAERELYGAVREAAAKTEAEKRAGRYREALAVIGNLRPSIDRFFDEVLVMDENPAVRENRLGLLNELLREFSTIADFSEMVAEEKR
jgi:glycyl-tRNA synthetase beta chain